jgi:hypothetical protein
MKQQVMNKNELIKLGYLEQIRRQTNLTITQIKTDTDDIENKRRIKEEK